MGDGLLIVRGGSGKVGTIVEAVAQTVERVGFQCGDICGGRRGERLQVTAEIVGGAAPAATDRDLCNRVLAEVRARRFTRTDDNAPESATAYITYTFK